MTPAPGRGTGVAMLTTAALLWSVSGVAVKEADLDPILFAALRSAGAGVVVLPLAWWATRRGDPLPAWRWMIPTTLVHTLMVATLISAMTVATAAEGILLQYTGPAWCALYVWLFIGRPPGRVTGVALLLSLAGVGVMLAGERPGGWTGPMLGVLSGAAYGGLIVLLNAIDRASLRDHGRQANVFAVVACNNLVSAAVLLPWAWLRGAEAAAATAVFVLAVGVVQMAAPYTLFQLGIRRVGPVAAGLIVLAEPVLNPLWVWLRVGERPPASTVPGGVLLLAAVATMAVAAARGRRRNEVPAE